MVHDVDHSGVPNAQLVKERAHVAGAYKNKSVAEQNSIELAWSLLMEPCYKELRESIFRYRSELTNFRSLVVTAVLATDIADKELAALRKGRAADALKAQEDDDSVVCADMDLVSRKATFVVETLIQVADVSHTMSSFSMYSKWNHRLYKEMYQAYKNGRAESDPTDTWYKGEFGFFDFYLIPLAKKLKECGIFGESGEEYLNNAVRNRKMWEERGEDLVAKYILERDSEEASAAVSERKEESIPERKITPREMELDEWASSSSEEEEEEEDLKEVPIVRAAPAPAPAPASSLTRATKEESDDDSVSISSASDSSEDEAPSSYRSKLALMREKMEAMAAGAGKVRSKASMEMVKDRRPFRRTRSADPASLARMIRAASADDREESSFHGRSRSQSPNAGPDERSRSRSRSPASNHARPRSILKSPSQSPSSGDEGSGRRRSSIPVQRRARSRSPQSTKKLLERAKETLRRGRGSSRSRSPTSNAEERKEPRPRPAGKVVRRGRKPSRSRSPASGRVDHTDERPDPNLKRGKRPSSLVKSRSSRY